MACEHKWSEEKEESWPFMHWAEIPTKTKVMVKHCLSCKVESVALPIDKRFLIENK